MGPLDNLPQDPGSQDPRELQHLLMSMTREIRDIQHTLLVQLNQDVTRLNAEKDRLRQDISHLQRQEKQLQTRQIQGFNRQQLAQQQLWSKQLAQVLASNLQEELSQRVQELAIAPERPTIRGASPSPSLSQGATPGVQSDNAYRLLASLDNTLNTTFKTLQQELSSYQSSISQQLSRMHSLQQQGEVILETLVERLIEQLQEDAGSVSTDVSQILGDRFSGPTLPQTPPAPPRQQPTEQPIQQPTGVVQQPPTQPAPTPAPAKASAPKAPAEPETNVLITGLIIALLSSCTISFQNIVTKVILSKQTLVGVVELGGYLTPSPGNSLLILVIRMALVVPLMGFLLAPRLYPNTWRDIRGLWNPEKRGLLWIVVGSGMFLFLSQFCIYIALGNMPTGVAITLFFIFPPVTALLAWVIFGARPTFIFALATITIYLGCFLTVSAKLTGGPQGNLLLGVFMAIGAGLTFAGYVILTQLSGKKLKLHPAPFSVINFSVILIFASLTLPLFPFTVQPENWVPLIGGTIALAATTLIGYALNNFAIPMIGAPLASVVAATGPGLTSLMALVFIGEGLGLNEWLGVIIVTLWVLGISVDNMNRQKAAKK